MKIIVLDLETVVDFIQEKDEETGKTVDTIDGSPFNPKNKIVTAHWRMLNGDEIGEAKHSVFYHNDAIVYDTRDELELALAEADLLVAHNAKFDIMWLLEAGFKLDRKKCNTCNGTGSVGTGSYYPDLCLDCSGTGFIKRDIKVYCTMIGEYILDRGVGMHSFSLEAIAERRNVEQKKLDITKDYFKKKIGYEVIPLPIVIEYGDADVLATCQVFNKQQADYKLEENKTLNNIVDLMNEMLLFLVEIERNGIAIDLEALEKIKQDYITEHSQLMIDLTEIARSVMGDEPFNLNSGPDLTKIVYSREVVFPERHKDIFKVGTDRYGNKQYPPYMTVAQFAQAVRTTTRVVRKKNALHCELCHGKGVIRKFKKNGEHFKNESKCSRCLGRGYTLHDTDAIAGLRLVPEKPMDASVHGFAVSKKQMDRLLAQATQKGNLKAVEFITKKKRLNAVNTYLNSFVTGIERWTRADRLLHANFNQTVAKTGRLSSSAPNFQNQPKEKKFPIRSCIVSRFKHVPVHHYREDEQGQETTYENGSIMESDFSGLEFRVAAELSRDSQMISDILGGKDIHRQTASIVHQKAPELITKEERNEVKPHTFAPLYYAKGGNEPDHIKKYYSEFYTIYVGHKEWLWDQFDQVIQNGFIRSPSGREYAFPGTKRLKGREVTNSTKISNYKIQGFATGDIVPLACIRAWRRFKELGIKSKLILTVHDSIISDVYPGEENAVKDIFHWAMTEIEIEIKERWNYIMTVPLAAETAVGKDWMNLEAIR